MISDNELIGLYCVNNDEAAFEQLIHRHASMVMQVCQTFLWNPADRDDAFQLVFVILSRKSGTLLRHGSIAGWLHNTAVKVSLNRRRAIKRQREVEIESDPESPCLEPWQSIANAQQCENLHLEIARLPRRYRDVIVLCHLNGASRSEAAENLDTTVSAVKAALARARKLLRQRLIQQGIGLSTTIAIIETAAKSSGGENQVAFVVKQTCDYLASSASQFSPSSNLFKLFSTKEISAMPVGIVNASLATAMGLVSIGAITLGLITSQVAIPASSNIWLQAEPAVAAKTTSITGGVFDEDRTQVDDDNAAIENADSIRNEQEAQLRNKLLVAQHHLAETRANLKLAQQQIEELRDQLAAMNSEQSTDITSLPPLNPEVARRALKNLDFLLLQSRQNLGPQHPQTMATQEQIDALQQWMQDSQALSNWLKFDQVDPKNPVEVDSMITARINDLRIQQNQLGRQHPQSKLLEAQIDMWKQFIENERSQLPPVAEKFRDSLFKVTPTQKWIDNFSQPDDLSEISVAPLNPQRDGTQGYEATDTAGNVLRRFLDRNGDDKFDTWIFFAFGRETYRDIDRDFDGLVEESQITVGDVIRIGKDRDQDGHIDNWETQRLSDLRK